MIGAAIKARTQYVKLPDMKHFKCPEQESPTFLKLRTISCVPINAKRYQFDKNFCNKNAAQFIFNYFSINN